ncbi:MAG TPA: hypothetical protein VHP33_39720, partial [Polyangiaceae bacterium]|nr:hypothetical protein [Polyangiaceae bacterium]
CADGGSCVNNKCVACGGKDDVCCDGTKCDNANLLCDSTTNPAKCKRCGSLLETCCPGDKCGSDMLCTQGTCTLCGKAGQGCCADATCTESNTHCNGGVCKGMADCSNDLHSGKNSPDSFDIEMKKTQGWATLRVRTYDVPDNIIISYEGTEVVRTGCFGTDKRPVGFVQLGNLTATCHGNGECDLRFRYGPGTSTTLNVDVIPNCEGTTETEWYFKVGCPELGL